MWQTKVELLMQTQANLARVDVGKIMLDPKT